MLYRSYFLNESGCIGTEVPQSDQGKEDLLALSVDALLDGVSIVARDVKTSEIVGISINKLQVHSCKNRYVYFNFFIYLN